ncbi:MAG: hypothetical protein DCC75_03700 [Proteobacteria bacterium]|nr:MAG: hypothetical protein DCC75_03700 [Pseudomonadota bacterium]
MLKYSSNSFSPLCTSVSSVVKRNIFNTEVHRGRTGLSYLLIAAMPASANAASAAGHGGAHDLPAFWDFFATLLPFWGNFIFYLFILFFLFRGSISKGWKARRHRIQSHYSTAQAALAESERKLIEVRERVKNVEHDVKELHSMVSREANLECKNIIEDAKQRALRIKEQVQQMSASEGKNIERIARSEMVGAALRLAREKLARELSSEADRAYRISTLNKVESLIN